MLSAFRLGPAAGIALAPLLLSLGALCGCGAQAHATSPPARGHAPFESIDYHSTCPANDLRHEASPDARTASVLVPLTPSGALVCRYWGLDDPGHRVGAFAGSRTVRSRAALARVAARLDALSPMPTNPPIACPADFARVEVVYFHYLHTRDDPVRIDGSGCVPVSNGRLEKIGLGLPLGQSHWPDEALM